MTNKDSTNNQGGAAASKSNMDNDSVEDAVIIEDENKEKNKVAASKNISGRSASDATSKAGGKEVSKKSTALSITALLIALLAVAAAAYIAWLSFQQAEQLQKVARGIHKRLEQKIDNDWVRFAALVSELQT